MEYMDGEAFSAYIRQQSESAKAALEKAFGPIDFEANNSRLAARSYLAGAGFWEINWEKA